MAFDSEEDFVQNLIDCQAKLAGDRNTWETHWEDVARYILPEQDEFRRKRAPGEKRQEFIFDSTGTIAVRSLTSIMDSLLTPLNQEWHTFESDIPELNRIPAVGKFFDEVTRRLFRARYRPEANFAGQNWERWQSIVTFGTGSLFIDDALGSGPNYKSIHLQETYFQENNVGRIDVCYRKYEMTAKKAAETFGFENLPEKMQNALGDAKEPNKVFEFIHAVMPNVDYNPERGNPEFMPFRSWHVAMDERKMLRASGFTSFPYSVGRFSTSPSEIYGRGPAMEMLPQIKVLHEERKTQLTAGHMQIHPTTLLRDDGVITSVDLRPGGTIVGGLDDQGNPAIAPFNLGADMNLSFDMRESDQNTVKSGFMLHLFEILIDKPQMTATEFLGRAQEKGMFLTPTIGRQMNESLGPQIDREIDILQQAGELPEPPPELVEAGGIGIAKYTGPMARAQKAESSAGASRTVQIAMETAAVEPSILDNVDFDAFIRMVHESQGAEQALMKDPELVAQIREQREQQATLQALADAAPGVAKAGLDVAREAKTVAETV